MKEASKYPLSNNNNAHSITKYGVLGRLDVQIVALRFMHPLKGHWCSTGQKDARRAPGALTLPPKPSQSSTHDPVSCSYPTPSSISPPQGCADQEGGGMNYETHPPRIWENPGTHCPTPTGRGGGGVGQPTTHPPTHPPKQYTRHKQGPVFRKFRNFFAYEQSIPSIQCCH